MEWCNAAFHRLTEQTSCEGKSIWQMIPLETSDKDKLMSMFAGTWKGAHEVVVTNRLISVEVTTMEEEAEGLFLVVLKDVTEYRARLKAEKAAERQALVAQAMNESMQTLSHELRTPLQGKPF